MAQDENKPKPGTLVKKPRPKPEPEAKATPKTPQVVSKSTERQVNKDFKSDVKAADRKNESDEGPSLLGDLAAVVRGVPETGKNIGKYLVNEDAWADILGPGDADWKDVGNAALDLTQLIPVAGLGGMAARGGIKAGAKLLPNLVKPLQGSASGTLTSRLLANEATDTAIRQGAKAGLKLSPSVAEKATLKGMQAAAPLGKSSAAAKGDDAASVIAKLTGGKAGAGAKTAAPGGRAGALNRKIGLGQTRRRTALTGAATVGLNQLESGYTAARRALSDDKSPGGAPDDGSQPYYQIGKGGPRYPLSFNAAGEMELPAAARTALADYYANGGSPDGTQVVYMNAGG